MQHRRPPRPAAGRAHSTLECRPGSPSGPSRSLGRGRGARQRGHRQPHLWTAVEGVKMSRGPGLRASPHNRAAQGHMQKIPGLRSSGAKLEITRPPGACPFGRCKGRRQRHRWGGPLRRWAAVRSRVNLRQDSPRCWAQAGNQQRGRGVGSGHLSSVLGVIA